jgi:hypothetical protein
MNKKRKNKRGGRRRGRRKVRRGKRKGRRKVRTGRGRRKGRSGRGRRKEGKRKKKGSRSVHTHATRTVGQGPTYCHQRICNASKRRPLLLPLERDAELGCSVEKGLQLMGNNGVNLRLTKWCDLELV